MTADGILAMQEIHKSNDMAPSRSFYTWHVSKNWVELKHACTRSLLRAAANTLSLLQVNRAKAGPVRGKCTTYCDTVSFQLLERVLRGEGGKKDGSAQKHRWTEAALMSTLAKLEQELCLFRYRWTTTAVT